MRHEGFQALRESGFDESAIVDIALVALPESGFARDTSIWARFEDGMDWPAQHAPSATCLNVIDR